MNCRDSSLFAQSEPRIDLFISDQSIRPRQLPIEIDDDLNILMNFDNVVFPWNEDSCLECIECSEMQRLMRNFVSLDELKEAMQIPLKNVEKLCMDAISCVGCRRSFENAIHHMMKFNFPTLDPLIIIDNRYVTLDEKILKKPGRMCRFFRGGSITRLDILLGCSKKTKRNIQRCILHSIDIKQNHTLLPVWKTAWDEMNDICKEHVTKVDTEVVHGKLVEHLKRHRFCAECRSKMFRAFTMVVGGDSLTGKKTKKNSNEEVCNSVSCDTSEVCNEDCIENDSELEIVLSKDKTKFQDRQLRITPKTEYVAKLISKAEPELNSKYKNCYNKREKHAKTIEIAQEEILACVGMCIYDRLYKVFLRSREEENNYRIFAFAAVDLLYRQLEMEAQKKRQGKTNIELYCEQLDKQQQLKRTAERKKQKKRKLGKQLKKQSNLVSKLDSPTKEFPFKDVANQNPEVSQNSSQKQLLNKASNSLKFLDHVNFNEMSESDRSSEKNNELVEFEDDIDSIIDSLSNSCDSCLDSDDIDDHHDLDRLINEEEPLLLLMQNNDGGSDISCENTGRSDLGYISENIIGTGTSSTANSQFEFELSHDVQEIDEFDTNGDISKFKRKAKIGGIVNEDERIPDEVIKEFNENREKIREQRELERKKLLTNFYRYALNARPVAISTSIGN